MAEYGYIAVARQRSLARELETIANNVANMDTTGFRREGYVFTEFVERLQDAPSVSLGHAGAHFASTLLGTRKVTGAPLDLMIDGEGYFAVDTAAGVRLTRAGAFLLSPESEIVTPDGHPLLDDGGAPIAIPAGTASIAIALDGTVSADGAIVARVGVVGADYRDLERRGDNLLEPMAGFAPLEDVAVRQGMLEGSNVDPVLEISRMIEVQRAYERMQGILESEDERMKQLIQSLRT